MPIGSTEKNGYSFKIRITGEELFKGSTYASGSRHTMGVLNPPIVQNNGAYSSQHGKVSKYNHWAFRKIVEPRYDSVGMMTGVPLNFPDIVQEHHMIGIMRSIEPMLKNSPEAMLQVYTTSPSVKK